MGRLRVFAAVPLPPEARLALAERVSGLSIPGRPVPPENWHLTVRFLGDVDPPTCDRFVQSLSGVEGQPPFRIRLDRFGAFPRAGKATVVWAGVGDGAAGLAVLNEAAEEAALASGLACEDRPFRPHLTLSRVRPPRDVRPLMGEELDVGWRCDVLVVFRSRQGRGGVTYEPLETLRLGM